MTLVVGLHLGTHAIVAADTKVSYHVDDVFGYEDDSEKLMMSDPGIISGAGLVSLLDNVKHRLNDEPKTAFLRLALVSADHDYAIAHIPPPDAWLLPPKRRVDANRTPD